MVDESVKAELFGLVLSGGRSTRMGRDKGSLAWDHAGTPQVRVAVELLRSLCKQVYVSINADQQSDPLYAGLPTIVDAMPRRGPAGGLLSAFAFDPGVAWLLLAVDMPQITAGLLSNLARQRDTARIATVHCHADGTIEPLCAIWEPSAVPFIEHELQHGRGSLRAIAQREAAVIARLPEPERLVNVNTPEERSALQRTLERADRSRGQRGD